MKDEIKVKPEGMHAIQSAESEMALLGAMMSEPETVIDEAIEKGLRSDDFSVLANQILFKAMTDMRNKGTAIDPSTVFQYLSARKLVEAVGGGAILGDLAASVVSVMTAPAHIKIIKQKSILRKLQNACAKIIHAAQERQHEAEVVVEEAERIIFSIAQPNSENFYKFFTAKDICEKIKSRVLSTEKAPGLDTGFKPLNQIVGGFYRGNLIVIAARPSVGKSVTALQIVGACEEGGLEAGIVSLEMSSDELYHRHLARHSDVNSQRISTNNFASIDERNLVCDWCDKIAETPTITVDAFSLDDTQIRRIIRRLVAQFGCQIVVVDYLQLIHAAEKGRNESRVHEVGRITRIMKSCAKEFNIPIVVLAQLSRRAEDEEPQLHHLRESGDIEQDADVVILMQRLAQSESQKIDMVFPTMFKIAKNRNGQTNVFTMNLEAKYARFVEASRLA